MKKLNITFCNYPEFGGNPKALYEYMVKRYKDQMNYTWIVYNEDTYNKLKKQNINVILMGSKEFNDYIPKTDVFFTGQGNLDADKAKTKNGIYIELWHGMGPKPGGFCQDHPSSEDIRGFGNIGEEADFLIVPSEFWRPIFSSIFKMELPRVKGLGYPLFDYFKNSNGRDNLQKVVDRDLSKYKKVIMYMPTFKSGFNHNDSMSFHNNLFNFEEKYSEDDLNEFLKKNNYLLVYKLHPYDSVKFKNLNKSNITSIDESALMENDLSVNEIINGFDMLITDYSSIGVEWLFLDKPILYSVGDVEIYRKNRGIVFDDIKFWCAGPMVYSLNELTKETRKLLEDSTYYKSERKEKKELFLGNHKDGGCKEICDLIFDGNKIRSDFPRRVSELNSLRKENIKLKEENRNLKNYNAELKDSINKIVNSKGWKMLEKLRKIKKIIRK